MTRLFFFALTAECDLYVTSRWIISYDAWFGFLDQSSLIFFFAFTANHANVVEQNINLTSHEFFSVIKFSRIFLRIFIKIIYTNSECLNC